MVNEPITAVNPAILTFVRYVAAAVGAILVKNGVLDDNTMNTLIGALVTVVPIAYGVYLSYKNAKALKQAAPYVSDTIINSK